MIKLHSIFCQRLKPFFETQSVKSCPPALRRKPTQLPPANAATIFRNERSPVYKTR